jgi:pimeloyl-ACP methyl ester carboxylesterase
MRYGREEWAPILRGPRETLASSAVRSSDQWRTTLYIFRKGVAEERDAMASGERLRVREIELEVVRYGAGRPILLLHGFQTIDPDAQFLDLLSRHGEIIAPSSPGFGQSPRPKDFDTVYDLVHLYLELLDALPGEKVTLVGFSFGGWLAAEVAVACGHRLGKLILVDPVGIKISDRETRDILDIFNQSPDEVRRKSWHDPDRFAPDFNAMSDEALVTYARNREALCLYAWHPYMYNPQLPRWLGRINAPTLLIWGESDGVVTPDYGRAFCRLIPGSRFELVEAAGHHPEIEQPELFVERVSRFLEE